MRLQSILVKPYVLECLNRFERERIEEEARLEAENPKKEIVFASTKKQLARLHQQMQIDKERKAKEAAERGQQYNSDDYEESTDSDSEEEQGVSSIIADIEAIVNTPRAPQLKLKRDLKIMYEEGMDRIEMPWRTEQKLKAKKEAPVNKVHDKKNFKGINES